MREAETYQEFARECRRMAQRAASEKDRAMLLQIADAWEEQVTAAGGKKKNQPGGGTGPSPK